VPEGIKKSIRNKKLIDVLPELARASVSVSRMSLRVLGDGTVIVEECEYIEEEVTT